MARVAAGAVCSRPIELDVSAAVPFAPSRLGGWVCAPQRLGDTRPVVVLACLAGGTCSTRYFDLEVDGLADTSMARYLASRGMVVIALDHPGIGASTPVDDIFRVTPSVVAAAQDRALREAFAGLRDGTLAPGLPPLGELRTVGVGHSMGGMILAVQQANHATFDAIAVLGHGGDGLRDFLTPDELALAVDQPYELVEAGITALARRRFATESTGDGRRAVPGSFMLPDVPDAVRRAFVGQQVPLAFTCGLTSMIPGATDAAKAAVTVPVFLGFGDHDLTDDHTGSLARYRAATDLTLYVLRGSAHCHNQATTRTLLWARLAAWVHAGSEEGTP